MRAVWHIAGLGNYQDVVKEQLALLAESDIHQVDVSFVGAGVEYVRDQGEKFGVKLDVVAHSPLVRDYERPAVEYIERAAHDQDDPFLYFHTKGVSRPDSTAKATLRRLMGDQVIRPWREHVERLTEYDAIGCNWFGNLNKHFSGNFWLATAAHIRRLKPIRSYYRNRFSCEFWIGTAPCKVLSLVCEGVRWWDDDFDWDHFLGIHVIDTK